jgi:hypothetical protein
MEKLSVIVARPSNPFFWDNEAPPGAATAGFLASGGCVLERWALNRAGVKEAGLRGEAGEEKPTAANDGGLCGSGREWFSYVHPGDPTCLRPHNGGDAFLHVIGPGLFYKYTHLNGIWKRDIHILASVQIEPLHVVN